MKHQSRFVASVLKTAKEDLPPLAFQRGARRKALIARLKADTEVVARKRA